MENQFETTKMDPCPSCGKWNESYNRFCISCGIPLKGRRKIKPKSSPILFLTGGIIIALMVGVFVLNGPESKLVGRVNGEGITRKDFLKRTNQAKKFYESRYGQNIFVGEAGKENMNRLKNSILNEMVTEKILLQEAKKAGFTSTSIPEKEIEERIEAIKRTYRLSNDDLKKLIGGSLEDLKEELRTELTISKFLQKTVLKEGQGNPDQIFGQWLLKVKANTNIETLEKFGAPVTKKASCCTSGCGGGVVPPLDPKIEKEAKAKALEYYEKKTQKKGCRGKGYKLWMPYSGGYN